MCYGEHDRRKPVGRILGTRGVLEQAGEPEPSATLDILPLPPHCLSLLTCLPSGGSFSTGPSIPSSVAHPSSSDTPSEPAGTQQLCDSS